MKKININIIENCWPRLGNWGLQQSKLNFNKNPYFRRETSGDPHYYGYTETYYFIDKYHNEPSLYTFLLAEQFNGTLQAKIVNWKRAIHISRDKKKPFDEKLFEKSFNSQEKIEICGVLLNNLRKLLKNVEISAEKVSNIVNNLNGGRFFTIKYYDGALNADFNKLTPDFLLSLVVLEAFDLARYWWTKTGDFFSLLVWLSDEVSVKPEKGAAEKGRGIFMPSLLPFITMKEELIHNFLAGLENYNGSTKIIPIEEGAAAELEWAGVCGAYDAEKRGARLCDEKGAAPFFLYKKEAGRLAEAPKDDILAYFTYLAAVEDDRICVMDKEIGARLIELWGVIGEEDVVLR